jgi:hypothetical protein
MLQQGFADPIGFSAAGGACDQPGLLHGSEVKDNIDRAGQREMGIILTMADQMALVPVTSVQIHKVEAGKAARKGSKNTTCAHEHCKTMHSMLKKKRIPRRG